MNQTTKQNHAFGWCYFKEKAKQQKAITKSDNRFMMEINILIILVVFLTAMIKL